MSKPVGDAAEMLRREIAANAARMIAQDGLDYGSAKRKAAHEVFGKGRIPADLLPANEVIEDEVRVYQDIFQSHSQPRRLATLRELAVELMRLLSEFNPYLTGAVLSGSAGEHSDLQIELYVDSAKDVEIYLLNEGIRFEARAPRSAPRGGFAERQIEEQLSFEWRGAEAPSPETVHLTIFRHDALRGALAGQRARERVDLAGAEQLLAQTAALPGVPEAGV